MRPAYPPDELDIRFHHRLVLIHPFPNGNGRHARLAADVIAVRLGQPRFSWGSSGQLDNDSDRRASYLRTADRDWDYVPLLKFARS